MKSINPKTQQGMEKNVKMHINTGNEKYKNTL